MLGPAVAGVVIAVLLLRASRERDVELARASPGQAGTSPQIVEPNDPEREREPVLVADRAAFDLAPGAGATTPERTEPARTGSGALAGRILTDDGFALAGVRIRAFEQREAVQEVSSLPDGRFEFSSLVPGVTYRLWIDERTLPRGILAPPDQGACFDADALEARRHATCVQIPEDGTKAYVELTCWRAARVDGRLLGPQGEPVPDTPVSLDASSARARTDASGFFFFEDVFPGEQTFLAHPARDSVWYSVPHPRIRFVVRPADVVVLPDLVFERGPASVRGRVIDQDGEPIANLAVLSYAANGGWRDIVVLAGTGADGTFRLASLPAEPIRVYVGATGYVGYEDLLVTHLGPIFELDLSREPEIDLGTIQVERDRPFRLEGRIETNAVNRTSTRFELDASFPGGPKERIRLEPRTLSFEFRTLRIDEPFTLVLTAHGGEQRIPIRPVPDGAEEIVIPYPPPR